MYEAGIWEQGIGFCGWSSHKTEAAAIRAAMRYARGRKAATGGALSWAGGVRSEGSVQWYAADGARIR